MSGFRQFGNEFEGNSRNEKNVNPAALRHERGRSNENEETSGCMAASAPSSNKWEPTYRASGAAALGNSEIAAHHHAHYQDSKHITLQGKSSAQNSTSNLKANVDEISSQYSASTQQIRSQDSQFFDPHWRRSTDWGNEMHANNQSSPTRLASCLDPNFTDPTSNDLPWNELQALLCAHQSPGQNRNTNLRNRVHHDEIPSLQLSCNVPRRDSKESKTSGDVKASRCATNSDLFTSSSVPLQITLPFSEKRHDLNHEDHLLQHQFCASFTQSSSVGKMSFQGKQHQNEHSQNVNAEALKPKRRYQHEAFPQKLYRLLEDTEERGESNIVSFTPSGLSFRVIDPASFTNEIAPRYFRHTQFHSFQRQLNKYGFERIYCGPDIGAYIHPKFQRGRPELLHEMKREYEKKRPVKRKEDAKPYPAKQT